MFGHRADGLGQNLGARKCNACELLPHAEGDIGQQFESFGADTTFHHIGVVHQHRCGVCAGEGFVPALHIEGPKNSEQGLQCNGIDADHAINRHICRHVGRLIESLYELVGVHLCNGREVGRNADVGPQFGGTERRIPSHVVSGRFNDSLIVGNAAGVQICGAPETAERQGAVDGGEFAPVTHHPPATAQLGRRREHQHVAAWSVGAEHGRDDRQDLFYLGGRSFGIGYLVSEVVDAGAQR